MNLNALHIGREWNVDHDRRVKVSKYQFISYYRAGYNGSTLNKASLSIEEGAEHARQLLDHLGIAKAHVMAFSFGGVIGVQVLLSYPDGSGVWTRSLGSVEMTGPHDVWKRSRPASTRHSPSTFQRSPRRDSDDPIFPPEECKVDASWIRGAEFREIASAFGHLATFALNDRDNDVLDAVLRDLLAA
jgi:pimeloyl-ACP methyl ester carboxylesterase